MFCNNCSNLAFKKNNHACSVCSRECIYKEQSICSFCATSNQKCCVCGKNIGSKKAIEEIHPFFGSSTGCKSCG